MSSHAVPFCHQLCGGSTLGRTGFLAGCSQKSESLILILTETPHRGRWWLKFAWNPPTQAEAKFVLSFGSAGEKEHWLHELQVHPECPLYPRFARIHPPRTGLLNTAAAQRYGGMTAAFADHIADSVARRSELQELATAAMEEEEPEELEELEEPEEEEVASVSGAGEERIEPMVSLLETEQQERSEILWLKEKQLVAMQREEYEECARLRDQIRRLECRLGLRATSSNASQSPGAPPPSPGRTPGSALAALPFHRLSPPFTAFHRGSAVAKQGSRTRGEARRTSHHRLGPSRSTRWRRRWRR